MRAQQGAVGMQRFSPGIQVNMQNQPGAGENGGMRAGLGCMTADAWERKLGVAVVSLAGCSPATDHQMVVETKAGGSPFAAAGAQSV